MRKIVFVLFIATAIQIGALAQNCEISSQWLGKKVAVFGDSISDPAQIPQGLNDVYWRFLEDILGIKPMVYAVNGHQSNQIIGQVNKMIDQQGGMDVDALMVFIGSNDYNASVPLGQWWTEDTEVVNADGVMTKRLHRDYVFSDDTFKGRLNTMLSFLKSHFPDKQIILLTPIHRAYAKFGETNVQPDETYANATGRFFDEYVNAIREASSIWAVPLIDMNVVCGLNPLVEEQLHYFRNTQTDRLHPNTEGHRRMAYALAYQMLAFPSSF